MNVRIRIAVLVVAAICLPSCGRPNSPSDYLDHMNAGDTASIKGDYAEAERHYRAALALAENDSNAPRIVRALHYLGMNYSYQKKYAEAEEAFKRQFDTAEKAYGAAHPGVLYSLSDMTTFYLGQKRLDEAIVYNQKALAICNKLSESERRAKCDLIDSLKDLLRERKEAPK